MFVSPTVDRGNYTFSVTRYSKYFPSINLVWASIPGRAVKIKVTTGIRTNSNGVASFRNREIRSCLFGLWRKSITRITAKKIQQADKIPKETLGKFCPITVWAKAGFKRIGIVAPRVIANQLTGHKKWSSNTLNTRIVRCQKGICV